MAEVKRYEELEFTDDFMFCKVLTTNPELTKELLETILGVRIRQIHFPESQKQIEITSDGRGVRLDVYVEDDDNTVYDVEMQTTEQKDLPKRTRYYQGMIDLNLIERGARYGALKKSFVIFLCLSDPFGKGRHIYSFENMCREDTNIKLHDDANKIIINAAGTQEDVSEALKDFLNYLREKTVRGELVRKIARAVEHARAHEEWRVEYMTLLMRDQQMRDEGRLEGRAEGRDERDREMIGKLLRKGWSIEKIHEEMEYPMEQILDVNKELEGLLVEN